MSSKADWWSQRSLIITEYLNTSHYEMKAMECIKFFTIIIMMISEDFVYATIEVSTLEELQDAVQNDDSYIVLTQDLILEPSSPIACSCPIDSRTSTSSYLNYVRMQSVKNVTIDGHGIYKMDTSQCCGILFINSSSTVTLKGLRFTGGVAMNGNCGGAINIAGSSVNIIDSLFDSNYNGAICGTTQIYVDGFNNIYESAELDLTISGTTLRNNIGSTRGGALYVTTTDDSSPATVTLSANKFSQNQASSGGSDIFLYVPPYNPNYPYLDITLNMFSSCEQDTYYPGIGEVPQRKLNCRGCSQQYPADLTSQKCIECASGTSSCCGAIGACTPNTKYCSNAQLAVCYICPANTYSSSGYSSPGDPCVPCDQGTHSSPGAITCIQNCFSDFMSVVESDFD
jgi:hypothetical protein